MKYIIYLVLFAFSFFNLSSLEPELYSLEGVEFVDYNFKTLEMNDEVYVVASDEENGSQIWKFDGAKKGMRKITTLPINSKPTLIDTVKGKVIFFTSADDSNSVDIWATNGFEEPEKIINNLTYNHKQFKLFLSYGQIFNFKEKFYINVYNRDIDLYELWATDGTLEGTKNYSKENNIYDLTDFYILKDKVVTIGHSKELPGELSIREMYATEFEGERTKLTDFEGKEYLINNIPELKGQDKLFFFDKNKTDTEKSHIWVTDGTKNGTLKLIDFNYSDYELGEFKANNMGDNYLLEYKEDSNHEGANTKIILTDGSKENSVDISSNIDFEGSYDILYFGSVNNRFLFLKPTWNRLELWSTNGEVENTKIIMERKAKAITPDIFNLTKLNNKFYFVIFDENQRNYLIETDGTSGGTIEKTKLKDSSFSYTRKQPYKDKLVITSENNNFITYDPDTDKLDFVPSEHRSIEYNTNVIENTLIAKYRNRNILFFNEYQNVFEEIKPIDATSTFSRPSSSLLFKKYLYFLANYYNDGYKLYRIDNTFQTVSNVEAQPTDELNLYPNPTGDMLNISVDEPTSVSIVDLTGKVVMSIENYSGEGVDTSQLPTGVYNIILDENTLGGKFVKE